MFAAAVPAFEIPAPFQTPVAPATQPLSAREAVAAVADALAEPSVSQPPSHFRKKRARDAPEDDCHCEPERKTVKRTLKCSNLVKLGSFAQQLEQGVPLHLVVERCFQSDTLARRKLVGLRPKRRRSAFVVPGDTVGDHPNQEDWFPLGA